MRMKLLFSIVAFLIIYMVCRILVGVPLPPW